MRSQINKICDDLQIKTGLRKHLAKMLNVHPSSVTNALSGYRTGPKEQAILEHSLIYLTELKSLYRAYSRACVIVNTKKR
jgi:hypothetical protein